MGELTVEKIQKGDYCTCKHFDESDYVHTSDGGYSAEDCIEFLLAELANKERETAQSCVDIAGAEFCGQNRCCVSDITDAINKHFNINKHER